MPRVTPQTNRVYTFAEAYGITPQQVVSYNINYFEENRTFWLPVGADMNIAPPLVGAGRILLVNDEDLVINDEVLVLD